MAGLWDASPEILKHPPKPAEMEAGAWCLLEAHVDPFFSSRQFELFHIPI